MTYPTRTGLALALLAVTAFGACQTESDAPSTPGPTALDASVDPLDGKPSSEDPLADAAVVVDFASTEFPPSVRKLGFNAQWNESEPADFEAIRSAAESAAPIAGGLVETKYGPSDILGATSTVGPAPLFFRTSGMVVTRADADLTALRQAVKAGGLINLLVRSQL